VDRCTTYEFNSDGVLTGNCVLPPSNVPYDVEGDRCVSADASGTARDAACQLGCTEENQFPVFINLGNGVVVQAQNNPFAPNRICNAFAPPGAPAGSTVSRESPNACGLEEGQTTAPLIAAPGDKRRTTLTVADAASTVAVRTGSQVANLRPTEGQLETEGGNCVGTDCDITFTRVRVAIPPFTLAGHTAANVILDNTTLITGRKDKHGRIKFPSAANFVVAGTVDGARSTTEFQARPGQLSASYDPIKGKLQLNASIVSPDGTQSLNVNLVAGANERPPRANAGPDQTVTSGFVRLNGSGSTDPDGDPLTFTWTEGNQVLATTAIANVTLPAGVHVILLTVADNTGRNDFDTVIVTVNAVPNPDDPASCPLGSLVLVGTPNNDYLHGTEGPDCIFGLGSQDVIIGGGGNDFLSGGDGDDNISGGEGDDVIFGGSGQDILTGGNGNDTMDGGDGDDKVSGEGGNDVLMGGQGQDKLYGGPGNDTLNGGTGDDRLEGGDGDDRLDGGPDHNICMGGAGTNVFMSCDTQQ
jgi:Ca2+-binding RTX toxin-like protein